MRDLPCQEQGYRSQEGTKKQNDRARLRACLPGTLRTAGAELPRDKGKEACSYCGYDASEHPVYG